MQPQPFFLNKRREDKYLSAFMVSSKNCNSLGITNLQGYKKLFHIVIKLGSNKVPAYKTMQLNLFDKGKETVFYPIASA